MLIKNKNKMILLGNTENEKNENKKKLNKKGKLVSTFFILISFLPILVYLIFHFGLIQSQSKFNQGLEKSVALVNTGTGTGTAFLISPSKLLTAKHVVKNKNVGDTVDLIFEKSEPQFSATAKIIWIDSSNDPEPEFYLKDVAVLELLSPSSVPEDYPYLTIGESAGVTTRSEVILIGYPGGLLSTTSGAISNDNIKGVELFQLDVESWPGNSGGPLVLEETEEVIGMLVAGLNEEYQGINFANKIDNITSLLEDNGIDIYE